MAIEIPALESCPFCDYLAGVQLCAFVIRGPTVSAFLNPTQYERGALLLMPNHHVETILEAGEELVAEVYREAHRIATATVGAFRATGLSIFQNNGVPAGQTVPHYHVHVVPRYPHSDPARRFREGDFEHTPLDQLESLARELRAALPER